MLGLGWTEIVFVAFVLLVVVGPERLPKFLRSAGQMYAKLRNAADEMRRVFVIEADRQDADERYERLQRRREQAQTQREAHETSEGAKAQARDLPPAEPVEPAEPAEAADGATPATEDATAAADTEEPASRVDLAELNRPNDIEAAHYDQELPDGVSAEEWALLPANVRQLLMQRDGAP